MDEAVEAALTRAGQHIELLQRENVELRREIAELRAKAITEKRVAEAVKDTLKYRESTEHLPDWLIDDMAVAVLARLKEGKA